MGSKNTCRIFCQSFTHSPRNISLKRIATDRSHNSHSFSLQPMREGLDWIQYKVAFRNFSDVHCGVQVFIITEPDFQSVGYFGKTYSRSRGTSNCLFCFHKSWLRPWIVLSSAEVTHLTALRFCLCWGEKWDPLEAEIFVWLTYWPTDWLDDWLTK